MDTPIISPWFFYCIDLLNKFNLISILIAVILFIYCIGVTIISSGQYKFTWKIKTFAAILILSFLLVPNKQTAIQMVIVSYVTPNNIQATLNTADKGVKYLSNMTTETFQKFVDVIIEGAIKYENATASNPQQR